MQNEKKISNDVLCGINKLTPCPLTACRALTTSFWCLARILQTNKSLAWTSTGSPHAGCIIKIKATYFSFGWYVKRLSAVQYPLPIVRARYPLGCRIFREISCFFPLNVGTLFRCLRPWAKHISSYTSLDSGVNEYLVGQCWQCLRYVQCAEMAAGLYALYGVEMAHRRTGPVTRG